MRATVEVHPAGDADVATLAELRAGWVQDKRGAAVGPDFGDRFAAWHDAQAGNRRAWLAQRDGEPVGMVNLFVYQRMPVPDREQVPWGYVGALFVRAEHRDAGIGRQLMEALVAWSIEHGLERLVVNPSDRSFPFYERLGFDTPPKLLQLDLPRP